MTNAERSNSFWEALALIAFSYLTPVPWYVDLSIIILLIVLVSQMD